MVPADLNVDHFKNYPAEARGIAIAYLAILKQLPLSFVPSLLRELIEYDYKFPAERESIVSELRILTAMSASETTQCFHAFSQISCPSSYERLDWISQPAEFTDKFSAYLWSSHQMNAFREAAAAYVDRMHTDIPAAPLPMRRLGMAVIGQGVSSCKAPLFRQLREHGTYFGRIDPRNGFDHLLKAATDRAQAHPAAYGHWYIDGNKLATQNPFLNCVSYEALQPVRDALLDKIQHEVRKPGMGPEELHARMARLLPSDLGMVGDTLLNRFQVKVLTEGSGTQIFSTTFVQWVAREVLRRAQALTLLVRFAPRQRERPMNELLSFNAKEVELDPHGSLVDADMGAYYQWINQQRLAESKQSSFLVWFEGHNQAIAIGPSLPGGTESNSLLDLKSLLLIATT